MKSVGSKPELCDIKKYGGSEAGCFFASTRLFVLLQPNPTESESRPNQINIVDISIFSHYLFLLI